MSTAHAVTQMAEATPPQDIFWQAVLNRDSRLDGTLYYGVRSTGIYCKPSCPSRRPRREQVDFFADTASAEKSGFRSCHRCYPTRTGESSPQATQVRRICRFIEQNLEETITLEKIAGAIGSSPYHLQRVFKQATGVTPHEYAEARRIAAFKAALQSGRRVVDAIYEAGFNSSSRVYERSNAHLGMTPVAYRNGGSGQIIHYVISDSPLGRLLVAATEKGVCKLSLGQDDAELTAALVTELPNAQIIKGGSGEMLAKSLESVLAYLRAERSTLKLPLDIQATAFQIRVWQQLQRIPLGETRSYAQIARELEQPTATRAVARACATNPVALAVPCHRVVRKSGELGGYRWGVERKRALLEMEQELAKSPKRRS